MAKFPRRTAAVVVLAGASGALALVLAHSSSKPSSAASVTRGVSRLAHESLLEQQNGAAADGPEAQAYADRAYPASQITPSEVQGAIKANDKLQKKGPMPSWKWAS